MPSGVWTAAGEVPVLGVTPGFGEPVGDGLGLGIAVGATVGDGLGTGVLLGVLLACGPQAPNTATEAAKIVDSINDLLIVFLLNDSKDADENAARSTDTHSRTDELNVFLQNDEFSPFAIRTPTLRHIERLRN